MAGNKAPWSNSSWNKAPSSTSSNKAPLSNTSSSKAPSSYPSSNSSSQISTPNPTIPNPFMMSEVDNDPAAAFSGYVGNLLKQLGPPGNLGSPWHPGPVPSRPSYYTYNSSPAAPSPLPALPVSEEEYREGPDGEDHSEDRRGEDLWGEVSGEEVRAEVEERGVEHGVEERGVEERGAEDGEAEDGEAEDGEAEDGEAEDRVDENRVIDDCGGEDGEGSGGSGSSDDEYQGDEAEVSDEGARAVKRPRNGGTIAVRRRLSSSSDSSESDCSTAGKFSKSARSVKKKYAAIAKKIISKIPPLISPLPSPKHPAAAIDPSSEDEGGVKNPFPPAQDPLPPAQDPLPPAQDYSLPAQAPRVSRVVDHSSLPVLAISMRPSHLFLRCYGLEVNKKALLETLVGFDPNFDDSGYLKANDGSSIGLFVTLRHCLSDSAARDNLAALSGLTGGFLGEVKIKVELREIRGDDPTPNPVLPKKGPGSRGGKVPRGRGARGRGKYF